MSNNKYEKLFDQKFVHFMWSNELEGKECFVADDIDSLMRDVLSGKNTFIITGNSHNASMPFRTNDGSNWQFTYYDPNYEVKRAYLDSKQIQFKVGGTWLDVVDNEPLFNDIDEYRIKPTTRENDPDDCHGCTYDDDNMYMCYRWCYKPKEEKYCVVETVGHGYELADANSRLAEHCKQFTGTKEECEHWIDVKQNCKRCVYEDSPCTLDDYDMTDGKCDNFCVKEKDKEVECAFVNAEDCPIHNKDGCEKCNNIRPLNDKRMTYRQLAEWCAKGNGQYTLSTRSRLFMSVNNYSIEDDSKELPDDYTICRWGSDEWIKPTEQIYLKDCTCYDTADKIYPLGSSYCQSAWGYAPDMLMPWFKWEVVMAHADGRIMWKRIK